MIRTSCKKAVAALLKIDKSEMETESRTPEVLYSDIIPLPNVQNVDLTMSVQNANVDSDDATDVIEVCNGCSGTVTRDSFTPDECAILLGEHKINGINVSKGEDEASYCAFGFQSMLKGKNADGRHLCMWILKTKFALNNMTAQSMGNESLTPQADSLSFKSTNRSCDGAWRFYILTNKQDEINKFFTKDTLNTITTVTQQTFVQPISGVAFVDTLPTTGEADVVYISGSKGYYWDGTEFVECTTKNE